MLANETGVIAAVLTGMTGFTGSPFLSLLLILIILIAATLAMGIEIEWLAIILLPLTLTSWAYETNFVAIGGVFLIYLGLVLAKNLFIK